MTESWVSPELQRSRSSTSQTWPPARPALRRCSRWWRPSWPWRCSSMSSPRRSSAGPMTARATVSARCGAARDAAGQDPSLPAARQQHDLVHPAATADPKFYEKLIFGYEGRGRVRMDLTDPRTASPASTWRATPCRTTTITWPAPATSPSRARRGLGVRAAQPRLLRR